MGLAPFGNTHYDNPLIKACLILQRLGVTCPDPEGMGQGSGPPKKSQKYTIS